MGEVKMRIFIEGDVFNKYIKFAGNYLDSFAIVFSGSEVHFLNTDPSKITMVSKKFEALDTDASIFPEEPIKVKVSDMIVNIVKKLGSKGYYMIEYEEGKDYITIGHGKDFEDWEEFYRINLNIIGTPEEVDEIVEMYNRFKELKENIGAYRFNISVDDIQKLVKIASLFDSNIKIIACEDSVEIKLVSDGKESARKKFKASTVELEKLKDDVDCVTTMISYTMFKPLKDLPKLSEYWFTVNDESPLIIEDDYNTFFMGIAPIKE